MRLEQPPRKAMIAMGWAVLMGVLVMWLSNTLDSGAGIKMDSSNELKALHIPVLGVRATNPSELTALVRSIDFEVDLLAISVFEDGDNHWEQALSQLERTNIRRTVVHRVPSGRGSSGGWNKIISHSRAAPYWLLVAPGTVLLPGTLRYVASQMLTENQDLCLWGLAGAPDSKYGLFVLTRRAVLAVGVFDESAPGVSWEDCDYSARLLRAECPTLQETEVRGLVQFAQCATGNECWSRGAGSRQHSFQKWGVDVCELTGNTKPYMKLSGYSKPFNRNAMRLSDWKVEARPNRVLRGRPEGGLALKWHEMKVDAGKAIFQYLVKTKQAEQEQPRDPLAQLGEQTP